MTQQEYNIDKIISYLSELQTQLSQIPLSKKATVNNNEQPSERRSEEKRHTKSCERRNEEKKRPSWWVRFKEKLKKICKVKNEATNHASDSEDSQGRSRRSMRYTDEDEDADLEIRKLQSDVGQMISAFKNLTQFQNNMCKLLEHALRSSMVGAILQKTDSIKSRTQDLKVIRRKISALKCQIPSSLYKQSFRVLSITEPLTDEDIDEINETGSDIYLPGLHVSEDFKHSSGFEDVVEKFQGLDFPQKLCLLSFSVFPENREVERTILMYWWIGEGFISCDDSENSVSKILDAFSAKKLLEPVEDERKLLPNSYKMEPHVHSAVIYLAKEMDLFELYSHNGELIMKKSPKKKVCLVKGSSLQREAKTSVMVPKTLQTVFNSSERYPDFTFKWFPLMDSLRVLYLGRWERTDECHIEVKSTEFLKNIKSLKKLRLASFKGISGIEKIENSVCALQNLVILDLRACYDLQVLPNDIGSLENLIYLDVSECLKLDRMPNGFEKISRLEVLKGFVISQSDDEDNCAFKHLVKLRKLSITIKNYRFKAENLIESLRDLMRLESLTIAWRARFPVDDRRGEETKEAEEYGETTNEEKENQKCPATEEKLKDLMERDDDQVHNTSPSLEVTETIQNKTDDHKGKNKMEEEGDTKKRKANLEEGKKQDELIEESKKDDHKENSKVQEKGDGDKGKAADLDEGKKKNEVIEESSKPDNVIEGDEKKNPPQESKDIIQSKPDDHSEISKVQEKGDGEKNEDDLKKLDGGEAKSQKSHKTTKFGKNVSLSEKSKAPKKPDDPKSDNTTAEEIHETPSPSRKTKSRKAKLLMGMDNQTKKWGIGWQEDQAIYKFPDSLKKLELECFPETEPPSWLNPKDLKELKKLSIKGGKLSGMSDESQNAEDKWAVEILRLKYLHEFKVEWRDLNDLFPKMTLLEKYKCPKISFCPTDGNGVWRSQPETSPNM